MKPAVLALLTLIASTSPALAADHGFRFTVEGFYIIDFVLLVVLLWAFTKGPIRSFFMKRHEAVKNEMEAASRLRAEAEARLIELEQQLSGLESEIAGIRAQFQADGEREKARILAEAAAAAEKLRHNAQKSLEQEVAKLREQLQQEFITQIFAATETKVQQRLDPSTQKKLATTYIDQLEGLDLGKAA